MNMRNGGVIMTLKVISTGQITNQVEYYIIDLFKLYLNIWPKDIPGASKIGFNFIFTNTKKKDLASEITGRVEQLITKIKEKFTKTLDIKIVSLDLIDETKVKLVISVNQVESDDILVDINETTG